MKNVPNRATGEAMPSLTRRLFLRGAAVIAPLAAIPALAPAVPAAAANRFATAGVDPIFAEIETHRAARNAFEATLKGATDEYLDSAEYAAIDDAERVAWDNLIETQMTTMAGLAAFTAHVLHSPALVGDVRDVRAILATIAVASAKFAYLGAEAGR